jgi:integrase
MSTNTNGTRARGTGSLKLVDGVYHARYYSNGKRHHESTKTGDLATAEKWLRKRLKAADTPQFLAPDARRLKYEDLVALLLADYARKGNRSKIAHALGHLADAFAGWSALRIDTLAIERYAAARRKTATVGTVNRELSLLRRMFNLAAEKKLLPRDALPTIKLGNEAGNVRQGFVEVADIDGFLGALRQRDSIAADAAELAFLTCLRRGNCLALTWPLFHLDVVDGHVIGGELRLPATMTKNKTGLVVPLSGRLLALVDRRWQARAAASPYLFHRDGVPVVDFRPVWKAATQEVGRSGLLFHDLRRSGARALRRLGVDELTIMTLGGWKTRGMFQRYSIVDSTDVAEALGKLDAALAAPGPAKVTPLRRRG